MLSGLHHELRDAGQHAYVQANPEALPGDWAVAAAVAFVVIAGAGQGGCVTASLAAPGGLLFCRVGMVWLTQTACFCRGLGQAARVDIAGLGKTFVRCVRCGGGKCLDSALN